MKHSTHGLPKKVTFRQWSRKRWSLFRILNQVVKICVLGVIYHNASAKMPENEFTNDTARIAQEYDLDEIEVSAQRTPVIFSEAARIISVITKEDLQRMPAQNLAEILKFFPGVDIRQRGPEGIQADLSIRGGTFDQNLILLNGINITDPQTGHHNLNIPVDYDQIERIEILQGPASRVYGPNAYSGAINIITRQPAATGLSAQFSYGSFNLTNAGASAAFAKNGHSSVLSASLKKSAGYIHNTDFTAGNLFFSSRSRLAGGTMKFQMGYTDKSFGANAFYTPRFPEQFEQTRTIFAAVQYQSGLPANLKPVIYWRRHHDRFELFRNQAPEWYLSHNYHMTDVFGIGINSWFISPLGKTAIGAEMRSESIRSNILGEIAPHPVEIKGIDALFTHFKSRTIFSVFAEQTFHINSLSVSTGILVNTMPETTSSWRFYPGIDIGYSFSRAFKWFFTASSSLRLPTFTDLYYKGPTNEGNPSLKPEKTFHSETGAKLHNRVIQGNLSIYHQQGRDLIDWIKSPGEEKWVTENLTSLNSTGIQTNLTLFMAGLFNKKTIFHSITCAYSYNYLNKKEFPGKISYYVMDQLKHKVTFSARQELTKKLSLLWTVTGQDRNGSFTSYQDNAWGNEIPYSPFWLIDSKLSYRFNNFGLYLLVNNLSNKKYYDIGNIPQPGRWIKAGIQVNLAQTN